MKLIYSAVENLGTALILYKEEHGKLCALNAAWVDLLGAGGLGRLNPSIISLTPQIK
jgi:hypothetical protein